MIVVDPQQTSSTVEWKGGKQTVALVTGLLLEAAFGTNAGLTNVFRWREVLGGVTTTPPLQRAIRLPDIPDEVRELRDCICERGLTRQDIARALGVDRRSLSGWVSGEIRPALERVDALRVLAQLVADIDSERPGGARDVLLSRRSGKPLLDRVATEGDATLDTWRSSARPATSVTVTSRGTREPEPIWAAAARALAEGKLAAPTWRGTVRAASTYETDPAEAAAFVDPNQERRRGGYR